MRRVKVTKWRNGQRDLGVIRQLPECTELAEFVHGLAIRMTWHGYLTCIDASCWTVYCRFGSSKLRVELL